LSLEEDPYPVYRELRRRAPVYRGNHPSVGLFWALCRFDGVQWAARNWELFSSAEGNDLDDTGDLFGPAPAMDHCDPPLHTEQRRAMRDDFSLRNAHSSLAKLAAEEVDRLLSDLAGRESVDFARDLAYRLPANLILRWLGFSPIRFRPDPRLAHRNARTGPGAARASAASGRRPKRPLGIPGRCGRRTRSHGWQRPTRLLAQSHQEGVLSLEKAAANAFFFFNAGIVSANALISNWFLHMDSNRDWLAWSKPRGT
jgi:cytochrome P450